MNTTIDLSPFCARPLDPCSWLHSPWRCSEGLCATNGAMLICVPDDGRQVPGEPNPAGPAMVTSLKARLAEIEKTDAAWREAKSIALPEKKVCRHCQGVGHRYVKQCNECKGHGEFDHGSHTYECKECNGAGDVTGGPSDDKMECTSCSGYGEAFVPVLVHSGGDEASSYFQRSYLARLAALPKCRICVTGPTDAALFIFDGGWGVLMPCRP